MLCPSCGRENPVQAKFCIECGARLVLRCAACGTELPPNAKFCSECGQPVAPGPVAVASRPGPQRQVPAHLAEKILTSRTALEGERKQVTVLFADLRGSMELLGDRDPEEARQLLDPVLTLMMQAVHRYEGTVNQVMGDGIMAIFGAPIAHEDHAVRACYAALQLQQAVQAHARELQRSQGVFVQVRVGVNSGEVVVRSIGSDLRMDYSAVGQTTNLAARMEQAAAPGSILLAPATVKLVEGYMQVRSLGPMQVKGIGAPVEVCELVGAAPVRTRFQAAASRGLTRFVGRDGELDTLHALPDRAGEGHGQIVAAVGEPGIGKSRLTYELVHSHRTQGWLILAAGSVSYGKATPYLPLTDVLRSYFQIESQDNPRRVREKVAGKVLTLDESLRPSLPAYLALLDAPVDDSNWQAMESEHRKRELLEAVRRLLLRESREQPVLVVFEDLHWIDDQTQALLDSLVESLPTARMLLLVNYRPEYSHAWGQKTYYTQLRLDPLRETNAQDLLDALLGTGAELQPVKDLLVSRTEGNPFFIEESVRTLVETGVLAGETGHYRLNAPLETTRVPATVQAVIAARIDRLPIEEKRLLQTASVIGKDVPYGLLQAVAEVPEGQLRARLAHLQASEFLYEASLFPELEYTFKHALTHEVTYASLLQERRRTLHAQLSDAMESMYAGRLTDQAERLAHHAVRGEVWDKAIHYLQEASQKAAARIAYQKAAQLLAQALEVQGEHLPDDLTCRCDLLLAYGRALGPSGEPQRAFADVAEDAFALAGQLGDRRRASEACDLALRAMQWYGGPVRRDSPEFRTWAERADLYAEPGSPARARADFTLARQSGAMGQKGRQLHRRALQTARAAGDIQTLWETVTDVLGAANYLPGEFDEWLSLAHEFSTRAPDGVSADAQGGVLLFSTRHLLAAGEREPVEQIQQRLRDLAARTRDPKTVEYELLGEAQLSTLDGKLERAAELGEELVARSAELGSPLAAQVYSARFTFSALTYLGQYQRAVERFDALLAASGRLRGLDSFRRTYCAVLAGEDNRAVAALRDFLDTLQVAPREDLSTMRMTELLSGAVVLGDRELAAAMVKALSCLSGMATTGVVDLASVGRYLGEAAAMLGDRAAARRYFEDALEATARLRHRPEHALVTLELAELLSEGSTEERAQAREMMDLAIPEFQAMKMQPALGRALRLQSLPGV